MQRCSLKNAWTMLLSRFNNTCWIHNIDEYCSINSCSMLTKNNNCHNVVGTKADDSWWNKLVDGCQQWLNNDCWTWTVACEQWLLTTVVERVQHNIVDRVQHNIATSCWQHWSSCSFLRVYSSIYTAKRNGPGKTELRGQGERLLQNDVNAVMNL